MTRPSFDPLTVLAPYVEHLVHGRRVLVFGNSLSSLVPALLDRGARLVHVYDPDAVRVAQASAIHKSSRAVMFAPLASGDIAVRDGVFDVVLAPDLSLIEQPGAVVAQARRLLAAGGTALFGAPNPDVPGVGQTDHPLSYYELYDAVSLQFPDVRMLGQATFSGYLLADLAPDDEPDVSVDTSLLDAGPQQPSWFFAVAASRATRLDPYAIVQVPEGDLLSGASSLPKPAETAAPELASERRKLAELQAELQRVRAQAAPPDRLAELESQLKECELRSGDRNVRAGQLEGKVRDLEEELRRQRERAFRLSTELDEEKRQRTKIDLELGMVRRSSELPQRPDRPLIEPAAHAALKAEFDAVTAKISQVSTELKASRDYGARLEQQLQEARDKLGDHEASSKQAAAHVSELKRTLRERDLRIVELDAEVARLIETQAPPVPPRDEILAKAGVERDQAVRMMNSMRETHEAELSALESKLAERGREVISLKHDVENHAQIVRELVLGGAVAPNATVAVPASEPVAELAGGEQLLKAEARLGRVEAELVATRLRIEQLEGELFAALGSPDNIHEELEAALAGAREQISELLGRVCDGEEQKNSGQTG